jgi:hypothetical protein
MSTPQVNINKWQEICKNGFSGDKLANDFILYLESCSKKHKDTITWTTTNPDFQLLFNDLNIPHQGTVFSIQNATWLQLYETKRQERTTWHEQRQLQLKHHLATCLKSSTCVVSEQYRRLEELEAVLKTADLGTVPLLRGLVGFFRYQLVHKTRLAQWHMDEYVVTQKDEDAMERDIHLLKQVLGFQLVYNDNDNDNDDTVIPMEQEQVLTWRMNADLSDHDINEFLKKLPKDQNTQGYQLSPIERKHEEVGVFQWLYQLVLRCFSIFS